MEVFRGNGENNIKGLRTYDFSDNGKHLMIGMDKLGYLNMALYYDNQDKLFGFLEEFVIDKSNRSVYDLFDKCFLSFGEEAFFSTTGAYLSMEKYNDDYHIVFTRNHLEDNKMIESRLVDDTVENCLMMKFYLDLQKYDPEYHQIHFDEYIRTLNKNKKNIEK